ncbi:MAG: DNA mismatch repair protein MutS [Hydrogenoanaerobacterium sp.]
MSKTSPMLKQYTDIKNQHKDHILFFRLGDFYEMFFDDALLASKELELTLTGRDCGLEERAPMCGVPYHSAEGYIARLIKKGYKVAICEQMEDPALAKGLVTREVVRVITPGTIVETSMLDEGTNNFIAGVFCDTVGFGVCFTDISTGEIKATQYLGRDAEQHLINELGRFSPKEIIFSQSFLDYKKASDFIKNKLNCSANMADDNETIRQNADEIIKSHFNVESLEALQLNDKPHCTCSVSILLSYLAETQKVGLERLLSIDYYNDKQYMNLSVTSRKNLELTETMRTGEKKGSLLWVLDKTKTAMGKRLLRTYLEQPLINPTVIEKRLNAVDELYKNSIERSEITSLLSGIFDIERLMTKVVFGNCTPRDLKALEFTALKLPKLKASVQSFTSAYISSVFNDLDTLDDICYEIHRTIKEEPPVTVKDGGVIEADRSDELDGLRDIIYNTKEYLAKIEADERQKTGINKLKIGYNRVFGYYIEITRSNYDSIPENYIRKQTLANCERFITEELKQLEEKILTANEKIIKLEQQLFEELRLFVASQLTRAQQSASAIARLDVYASFAETASLRGYTRPSITSSDEIVIKDGRHPVVEALLAGAPFVANDSYLNGTDNQINIITGPNMAGKSTYMRQVALIVLMAQIGSFVPASNAKIGIVDGIFTRVGASDDLTSGQSTFMVEMNEVAQILRDSSSKSLLILDEIGRGTSTFDGMSIARAVIEHIAEKKKCGAKTLFATHYHELTELEESLFNVKNYNIAVKKRGDDITFLRRIVRGGADDSYGIEVSKLAGIPESIIKRAHEILLSLEAGNPITSEARRISELPLNKNDDYGQTSLLPLTENPVITKLSNIDVDTLTPIEAISMLYDLKNMLI